MTPVLLCLLVSAASLVLADYDCVCNYNVEQQVLNEPATTATAMGYMYEFDCKENVPLATQDSGWFGVAIEHHLGYVKAGDAVELQVCQGSPPVDDKIVPTTLLPTTVATTTPKPTTTTTTPKPTTTTTTTTPKPTTTSTTTPIPTTTTTTTPKPTTTTTTPKPTTTTTTPKPTTTTPKPTTTTTTTTQNPTTSTTTRKPITTTQKPTTQAPVTTHIPTSHGTTIPKISGHSDVIYWYDNDGVYRVAGTSATTFDCAQGNPCYNTYHQYASMIKGTLASYGHVCYEFVTQHTQWASAEADCVKKGGHLATITSSQEQNFIYNYLQKHYDHEVWIGFHDHETEEKFQWISGHAVTYTHWSPYKYEFNNSYFHELTDCVMLDTTDGGFWKNRFCDIIDPKYYGYVCQYGFNAVVPATQAPSTHAPSVTNAVTTHAPSVTNAATTHASHTQPTIHTRFSEGNTSLCSDKQRNHAAQHGTTLAQHGRYCYELVPTQRMTWQHCELYCENGGGHLAHIASASEQAWIQEFMEWHLPQHAVWIGLHDLMNEGHYQWTSGDSTPYTNFVPGHLSNYNHHNVEDCFLLIPYKGGKWDDIVCGTTTLSIFGQTDVGVHPPLCQFPISQGVSLIG